MDIKTLANDFSVSAQISAADVVLLKSQGFKSIICSLPDGERVGQTRFADISATAVRHGLEAVYLPIMMGSQVQERQIKAFRQAIESLPKPTLGYCRSGMRATTLWTQAQPTSHVPASPAVNKQVA